jgi:hypothetical protein
MNSRSRRVSTLSIYISDNLLFTVQPCIPVEHLPLNVHRLRKRTALTTHTKKKSNSPLPCGMNTAISGASYPELQPTRFRNSAGRYECRLTTCNKSYRTPSLAERHEKAHKELRHLFECVWRTQSHMC